MKVDIEARREKILRIIINTYITTGDPVASRTICTKYRLSLCPASVRNVMADLEERGYITHLHTSAGRIPTDKGYRFYVDRLLKHAGLTQQEQSIISKEYINTQRVLERIIRMTSKVLSDFTSYAGVVSQPEIKKSRFKRIHFVLLGKEKICVTLVANTGITRSSIVCFDFKIDQDKLNRIENFMNAQLEDIPLPQIKTKLRRMMIQERNSFFHVLKQAIEFLDLSFLIDEKILFYLEGLSNILNFPEFEDTEIIRSLMKVIEEKMALSSLLQTVMEDEGRTDRVKVFIGEENPPSLLSDCAVVLKGYKVDDQVVGGLGIIGPKRMDYGKAIATVRYVSDILSDTLSRFSI